MLLNSHPVIDQSVCLCVCACVYTYTLQPVSACKTGKFIVALIIMLPLPSVAFILCNQFPWMGWFIFLSFFPFSFVFACTWIYFCLNRSYSQISEINSVKPNCIVGPFNMTQLGSWAKSKISEYWCIYKCTFLYFLPLPLMYLYRNSNSSVNWNNTIK